MSMGNLNYSVYQYAEMALRIIVACGCGALVGYEREKKFKNAGLRTHIIVCCSAALLMIVSKYGFSDLVDKGDFILGTKGADPARIAAQVISGVSFIGAGVIFHNKNNTTKGLTTASGLWAIAGIGLAIGSGMYFLGIFSTVLIAIIQTLIQYVCGNINNVVNVKLTITATNSEQLRNQINEYLNEHSLGVSEQNISIEGDIITYKLTVKMTDNLSVDSINSFFEGNDSITSINCSVIV